ncbi:uncharacterized protein METZ01_LOCUS147577, partial [marine metagenome]
MGKFSNVRTSRRWRLKRSDGTYHTSYAPSDGRRKDIEVNQFNYNEAAPSPPVVKKDMTGMHTGVKCVNCKKEFNLFTSKDSEKCDDC